MNIERAILSVSDKTGIIELARFLVERKVEILSTGGTAQHLAGAGIPVTSIAKWSGAPEILGGRVKTLTPKVFGSILFDRSKADHLEDCQRADIPPVDLVVVNLYPFEQTIRKEGVTVNEAVEQIDVGGPSMLRAAAKNHRSVIPLCDPSLYGPFMKAVESGEVSEEFRRQAAVAVFRRTALYDSMIADFLAGQHSAQDLLPEVMNMSLRKVQSLRYGENPQQSAAFYIDSSSGREVRFRQLHGKELSYNNLLDLDAALRVAGVFADPACAIIKHTNPCGVAEAPTLLEAVERAIQADPISAFGGIVAANRPFNEASATRIAEMFLEVVIAPSFDPEAAEILGRKKNLRLVVAPSFDTPLDMRSAAGGYLLQSSDGLNDQSEWKSVTRRQPTEDELVGLAFGWKVCRFVKSNAIVLARHRQTVGIGAGQMSRIDSARLAVMKSVLPVEGSVVASDAFFPFRDGLDLLADAGVTAVVQPGGSVRDEEVVRAADERGLAMLFTRRRHFRH